MKAEDRANGRGIVIGVLVGSIAALLLQAAGMALWLCLVAGLVVGLEVGYFVGLPRETWAMHKRAFQCLAFFRFVERVEWRVVLNDMGRLLLAIGTVLLGLAILFAQIGGVIFLIAGLDASNVTIHVVSFGELLACMLVVIFSLLGPFLFFEMTHFKCFGVGSRNLLDKIVRWPWQAQFLSHCLTALILGGVALFAMVGIMLWVAASVLLLSVLAFAAFARMVAKASTAVITTGVVVGVIASFSYSYAQGFVLADEVIACVLGAMIGFAAGQLCAMIGRSNFFEWLDKVRQNYTMFRN